MFNDNVGMSDYLEVIHKRNGQVVDRRVTGAKSGCKAWYIRLLKWLSLGRLYADDLITNVGKAEIADAINDRFGYLAIGTDQGVILALAATNTTLGNETNRASSTNTRITTNVANDTARMEATITFSADTDVKESGMFDANSAGNMLCRQTFDVLSMKNGDSLTLVWKVVVQ